MKRALRSLSSAFLFLSIFSVVPRAVAVSANPTPNCSAGSTCTITFAYTGDYYAWTVPSGVTSLTIDAYGAQGGSSYSGVTAMHRGGYGGRVQATLSVTAASTLYFYVGGAGGKQTAGWNGGGTGANVSTSYYGGGGGGASDIRTTAGNTSTRLIVAAGGGGAGFDYSTADYDRGGNGGGTTGENGFHGGSNTTGATGVGVAGSPSAAGTGGVFSGYGSGSAGVGAVGGDGGTSTSGGGGGGGYFGGGGGSWGGGGGGSSYTDAIKATSVTHTQGSRSGSGQILVTYLNSPMPTTFSTSQTTPTNISTGSTISYSLVLSQSVSDLATSDFKFGGTSSCDTPGLSGSGTNYTVTVTNCSEGTLILQLKANSVTGTSSGPSADSSANTIVIDRTAPTISSVTAPANATYKPSDTPTFTMVFSESVTVTGTPRLTLTVGVLTKYATYVSMTDSKTALFRYTVGTTAGEFDTDGIAVATTLDFNGGAIADLATNSLSPLTFTAPTLTSVLISQPPSSPTIDSISATSGTLTVYFTAGAINGSSITNYQYSTDNGSTWKNRATGTTASPIAITTVSASATALTNGTAYQVRIRAINLAGTGDSSTAVSATPSAVIVSGDATLTLTYGSSASTGTYTSTGGTAPYTYTLSSTPSGVSISAGVVTASSTTPAGTYTQNVVSTDAGSQSGVKQLIITVNKATTSISIALPNSATTAAASGTVVITATVSRAGTVNFKLGGSTISGCGAASAASTTATCNWTAPGTLGSVNLTADFTPSDTSNYETSTSTTLTINVVNGVSSVTLSLTGGVTQVPKGQNIVISAVIDQAGKLSFYVDGKRLANCFNKTVAAGTRTCTWKPAVQKEVTITATLNPTNNVYQNSSDSMRVWVVRRENNR